jgi:peptidoglycan/LPS O-acetylase OafA/YrhL
MAAWHAFNISGGFYGTPNSPLWIVLPTLQGLAFGAVIVGYEQARFQLPRAADRALAKVGEVSYSIYLLHFIFYPTIVKQLVNAGVDMASFAIALAVAALTFPLIVCVAMLSYRFIEQPFLRLRGTYDRKPAPAPRSGAVTSAA